MSRSKRLGSIYANNRKRRVVSDDESEQEETSNWTEEPFNQHQQRTHSNGVTGEGEIDPVARCEGVFPSVLLSIMLQNITQLKPMSKKDG